MSATAELSLRVKPSDPKPDHCSMCFCGPQEGVEFFDGNAELDRGTFVDKETEAYLRGVDDLHLCRSCVEQFAQAAAFKPDLHQRQLREIQRLTVIAEHERAARQRAEAELAKCRQEYEQMAGLEQLRRRRA